MGPFRVEFIRFDRSGKEASVVRRDLEALTVFDAEREALHLPGEGAEPMMAGFDAAFLCCGEPRLRRYGGRPAGWGRA